MSPEKKSMIKKFIKFALVGGLNTLVDLLVLNILIFTFNAEKEAGLYLVFKTISFIAAVSNSYLFNKFWVFKASATNQVYKEGSMFLVVSVIGLIINAGISFIVFKILGSVYPDAPALLTVNAGALAGTAAVLFWNFFGYTFFVFKKQS